MVGPELTRRPGCARVPRPPLHGDHGAHFSFPRPVWHELQNAGRIVDHPVFPGRVGPAARRIESDEDVRDVISLLRLNYDRMHP